MSSNLNCAPIYAPRAKIYYKNNPLEKLKTSTCQLLDFLILLFIFNKGKISFARVKHLHHPQRILLGGAKNHIKNAD